MTKREALADFKANVLPNVPSNDKPAKGEAWCRYVDLLHRDGRITDKQAQNWDNPFYK